MPTIQVTTDDLLEAVKQLAPDELEGFVSQVIRLQAQRRAPSLPHEESELLQKINQGLPNELHKRYKELLAKRDARTLTDAEYSELLAVTDQVEQFDAQRALYIAELAKLRGTTLPALMRDLGINQRHA